MVSGSVTVEETDGTAVTNTQSPITGYQDAVEEALAHAPSCASTQPELSFGLLDRIDELLTEFTARGQMWPSLAPQLHWAHIEGWAMSFLDFAVSANMQTFVKHRLEQDKACLQKHRGRPVLCFATSCPGSQAVIDPAMVRLLLMLGADPSEVWQDRQGMPIDQPWYGNRIRLTIAPGFRQDAARSLQWNKCDREGNPHAMVLQALLEGGLNPKSTPKGSEPLSHLVVTRSISPRSKLTLLKMLDEHGVNFMCKDSRAKPRGVLDAYFFDVFLVEAALASKKRLASLVNSRTTLRSRVTR